MVVSSLEAGDQVILNGWERRVNWQGVEWLESLGAAGGIKGFEVMRAFRKGHAQIFNITGGICSEARLVERAFGLNVCRPSAFRSTKNRIRRKRLRRKSSHIIAITSRAIN